MSLDTRWKLVRKIAAGAEGATELHKSRRTGELVIIKKASSYVIADDIPREVKILQDKLGKHPRILDMMNWEYENDWRIDRRSLLMVYEYCAGGDLSKWCEGGMSESFLWHVFTQLAEALAYLHEGYTRYERSWPPDGWRRVVHCDIKPDNVLLRKPRTSEQPYPDVVLADFGYATLGKEHAQPGHTDYAPPELPKITPKYDVWSLGSTIHEMANGFTPLGKMPRNYPGSEIRWRNDPKARRPKPLSTSYSSRLNRNMMECLEIDRHERVTSLDLFHNLRKERPRH